MAKFAYVPLAALPPLIAAVQGRPKQTLLRLSAVSFTAAVIWAIWSHAVADDVFPMYVRVPPVDVHRQLRNVVDDPAGYARVFIRSVVRVSRS